MSLWRSGSWTVRRASSTCSWVTLTGSSSWSDSRAIRRLDGQGLVDGLLQLLELVWAGCPGSSSRIMPLASMTNVVGKPWLAPKASAHLVVAQELAVRDAVLADEVLDLLRLAGVEDDADHLDAARRFLRAELGVVGHLRDAGPAPGGPEVQHHHLALQRRGSPCRRRGPAARRPAPRGPRSSGPGRKGPRGPARPHQPPAACHASGHYRSLPKGDPSSRCWRSPFRRARRNVRRRT